MDAQAPASDPHSLKGFKLGSQSFSSYLAVKDDWNHGCMPWFFFWKVLPYFSTFLEDWLVIFSHCGILALYKCK